MKKNFIKSYSMHVYKNYLKLFFLVLLIGSSFSHGTLKNNNILTTTDNVTIENLWELAKNIQEPYAENNRKTAKIERSLFTTEYTEFEKNLKEELADKNLWLAKDKISTTYPITDYFVQKMVLDPAIKVVVKSDIHGDFCSFMTIIKELKDSGIVDDNLIIDSNYRLVILGDNIDSGDFSCEVLFVLMRLKNKNGNKIVLLMGNHEEADYSNGWEVNKNIMSTTDSNQPKEEKVSFGDELKNKFAAKNALDLLFSKIKCKKKVEESSSEDELDDESSNSIFYKLLSSNSIKNKTKEKTEKKETEEENLSTNTLYNLFKLLPVALYVGTKQPENKQPTEFILCCHGGQDYRFDPTTLLTSSEEIKYQKLDFFPTNDNKLWFTNLNYDHKVASTPKPDYNKNTTTINQPYAKLLFNKYPLVKAIIKGHQHDGWFYNQFYNNNGLIYLWENIINYLDNNKFNIKPNSVILLSTSPYHACAQRTFFKTNNGEYEKTNFIDFETYIILSLGDKIEQWNIERKNVYFKKKLDNNILNNSNNNNTIDFENILSNNNSEISLNLKDISNNYNYQNNLTTSNYLNYINNFNNNLNQKENNNTTKQPTSTNNNNQEDEKKKNYDSGSSDSDNSSDSDSNSDSKTVTHRHYNKSHHHKSHHKNKSHSKSSSSSKSDNNVHHHYRHHKNNKYDPYKKHHHSNSKNHDKKHTSKKEK